ncbi:MAG: PorV/PorQ family protein [Candidatus Goldiibacteriota bacterium]
MKRIMIAVLILIMIIPAVWAAEDYGTPGEFLTWGAGARSLGMGKAFTGLADDPSAVIYNPGGLAQQNPFQISLMSVMLFEGTFYDFAALTLPFSGIGTFALGYVRLDSGGFDLRDDFWNAVPEADNLYSQGIYFSYSRDILDSLAAGASLKIVNQQIFDMGGTGFGADLGIIYTPMEYFSAGLAVLNIMPPSVLIDEATETYPVVIRLGLAGRLAGERIMPTLDIEKEMSGKDVKIRMGVEVIPMENLALRAGFDETEITFGAGYKIMRNYIVDYSMSVQELGITHRASFTFATGGFDVNLTAEPKLFSPVGVRKTTTISIYASTKYPVIEWEMSIINENDDVVRFYSGYDRPPEQIIWDGKDDRGLPVSDGEYKCVMKVIDKNRRTIQSAPETVRISSSLPMNRGTIHLEE